MRCSSRLLDPVRVVNLGRISYSKGLLLQKEYTSLVAKSKVDNVSQNFFLVLEHLPVYTIGIRSKLYSIEEETRLRGLGADFFRTSRGGLITFHGPGQLVVYPIVDLRRFSPRKLGVRLFVEYLEQAVIDCSSSDFGVRAVARSAKNTGVWVNDTRKLCAIGISVQHGITGHGLAINCNTDLRWFDHIVACGVEGAEATSISKETGSDVTTSMVATLLVKRLADVFQCEITL